VETDHATAYEDTRRRIAELARSLSAEELARTAPATPDWTAKDLIAHLVGLAVDVAAGRVDGIGSPPWTQAQVDRGRNRSVEDLLAEWDEIAPRFAQGIGFLGRTGGGLLIGDIVTHEHDLRGVVNRPGARNSIGMEIAVDTYVFRFRRKLEQEGLGPVLVSDGVREWRTGEGEPKATVSGEPFELLRSLTGRRTPAEIQSNLTWSGDASTYLPYFSYYGTPETSLGE
jgi:uncharacterized protein (TIGR03083 family)